MEAGETQNRVKRLNDLIKRADTVLERGAQPEYNELFEAKKLMYQAELELIAAREIVAGFQVSKAKSKK